MMSRPKKESNIAEQNLEIRDMIELCTTGKMRDSEDCQTFLDRHRQGPPKPPARKN